MQIALLSRHAVQRLDVGGDGHHGDELGVGVIQQLAPGPVDRHRLHVAAVPGEPPLLDQAAPGEEIHRVAIGLAVERHREVQVARVDAERRARDGHALRIAGELELGRGRHELLEHHVAVAQDIDLAGVHAPMHPARHLEDLVGPQVEPGEHVATPLHHVGVARVVDHHGVQAADVERGLPGRRHRQEKGPSYLAVEKRPDHPDRLTAVVERGGESLPAAAELLRDLLDLGAGGHEHRHAASLAQHPLHEAFVEEFERLLRQHAHPGGLGGIERARFEHLDRAEIARVKRGVDRRRQPHEAAAGALPEREAQLQLRGGLMDLVDHQRVARRDEPILEPAARDSGRDDDDVPGRRLGRRLALAVHHADLERSAEHRGGDRPDRERLPRARPRDDAESASRGREPTDVVAVLAGEQRVDLEAHRQLDRLARGARRGDHDHAPGRRLGGEEGGRIGGKEVIARQAHGRNIERRQTKSGRHACLPLLAAPDFRRVSYSSSSQPCR